MNKAFQKLKISKLKYPDIKIIITHNQLRNILKYLLVC